MVCVGCFRALQKEWANNMAAMDFTVLGTLVPQLNFHIYVRPRKVESGKCARGGVHDRHPPKIIFFDRAYSTLVHPHLNMLYLNMLYTPKKTPTSVVQLYSQYTYRKNSNPNPNPPFSKQQGGVLVVPSS
jgi:hypothetical protein